MTSPAPAPPPTPPDEERLEYEIVSPAEVPGPPGADLDERMAAEIEELIAAARRARPARDPADPDAPCGSVCNAEDAPARSDAFSFWAPSERADLGIGTIVRHRAAAPGAVAVDTYAIIVDSSGQTLGLARTAIGVAEVDGEPPEGVVPAPSQRRPVAIYTARVLNTTQAGRPRPVVGGPVYAVAGTAALLEAQSSRTVRRDMTWLRQAGVILGFYEDGRGEFAPFVEERRRVFGPQQGHVVDSGAPGGGKTSHYVSFSIGARALGVPAAFAIFNIKGADLLFLDYQRDPDELADADRAMWASAGVDVTRQAFARVTYLVPIAPDGVNLLTLRDPAADQPGYSRTVPFALGLEQLWPALSLLFDDRSSAAANLMAEVREYFERQRNAGQGNSGQGFTLAAVLAFFDTVLRQPQGQRNTAAGQSSGPWDDFNRSTINAVRQRLASLPAVFGGLIDLDGAGFGLEALADLEAGDLVVIDLERMMAMPSDPELAEVALKIVVRYVLSALTDAVTRGRIRADNVVVFADELNRLAPARGESGVGEYLANLARTTRDRGIILFGAGQYRSGINPDILKSAAVHCSMRTPDYELSDPIYNGLTDEVKARLTGLEPGEFYLQFPSLRTGVFARFPLPFLLTGPAGLTRFPPPDPRPIGEAIAARLARLAPDRPPDPAEVMAVVDGIVAAATDASDREARVRDLARLLREFELSTASRAAGGVTDDDLPWPRFRTQAQARYGQGPRRLARRTPGAFTGARDVWDDDEDADSRLTERPDDGGIPDA